MALNTTTAVIGSGCNTATATPSLVQWDQGQILKIEGVQLPETYQAEFCCQGDTETMTMLGSADGVRIPDELLARGLPIFCYIVLHEGEDDRETEYTIRIYVQKRAEPTDIEPDPGQQSLIDQILSTLEEADSAVSSYRADEILNAGNILAEIGTFNAHPSPALTFSWSDGNTRAHITGTPTYQNMIGLYSFGDSGGITPPLAFDTEYELRFGTDNPNISLYVSNGSSEAYYTGDTTFTIASGTGTFEIAIVVEAGTVDSNVLIGIPYPKSHMDLEEEIQALASANAHKEISLDQAFFGSGGYSTSTGATNTNNARIRLKTPYSQCVHKGDYIEVDPAYNFNVLFYNSYSVTRDSYVGAASTTVMFHDERYWLPDAMVGNYFVIALSKYGHENDDISAEVPQIYQKIHYYRRAFNGKFAKARSFERFRIIVNSNPFPDNASTEMEVADHYDKQFLRGILALPANYQATGRKTEAIMICHGLHGYVSNTGWYGASDETSTFLAMVQAYVDSGFAVFDVDQLNQGTDESYDLGAPAQFSAYIQLWNYIHDNYNVQDRLFIHGFSQGGFVSIHLMRRFPSLFKAGLLTGFRASVKTVYDRGGSAQSEIGTKFGFSDPLVYEADKVIGFDLYSEIETRNSQPYVPVQFPPIKAVTSLADTNDYQVAYDTLAAIRNGGNYLEWRILETATHGEVCAGIGFVEEFILWFQRFINR